MKIKNKEKLIAARVEEDTYKQFIKQAANLGLRKSAYARLAIKAHVDKMNCK